MSQWSMTNKQWEIISSVHSAEITRFLTSYTHFFYTKSNLFTGLFKGRETFNR